MMRPVLFHLLFLVNLLSTTTVVATKHSHPATNEIQSKVNKLEFGRRDINSNLLVEADLTNEEE